MAWTIGNALNNARKGVSGAGTQIAGLSFGGIPHAQATESFNGSIWSNAANMNVSNAYHAGAGTSSAALSFGSYNSDAPPDFSTTEEYSTTWTTGNKLNTSRYGLGGCGVQTAALSFGGIRPRYILNDTTTNSQIENADIDFYYGNTETYDGTSWTASSNMNSCKAHLAGAGTQSAGLCMGGIDSLGVSLTTTEEFDGSTWSTSGALNTGRPRLAANGTQSASLSFGGYSVSKVTEIYNGAVWAVSNNMNIGRQDLGGNGTSTAGTSFGGLASSISNTTELFT